MPQLSSLANSLDTRVNSNRGDITITLLNPKDDSPGVLFAFQYFPETYTDTKDHEWASKSIPGGSLPLKSWISGGDRLISFTATFTSDVDLLAQGKAKAPLIRSLLQQAGVDRRSIDVRTALAFLGNLREPTYVEGGSQTGAPLTIPPPKLVLSIPGSGIGVTRGLQDGRTPIPDSIICILQTADITYQAMFPSGLPRIANVDVVFAQIPQVGGQVIFPQAYESYGARLLDGASFGGGSEFYPYPIRPRKGKGG